MQEKEKAVPPGEAKAEKESTKTEHEKTFITRVSEGNSLVEGRST